MQESRGEVFAVRLEDGTRRLSLAKSNEHTTENKAQEVPACVRAAAATVSGAFDEVEAAVMAVLAQLLGGNSSVSVVDDAARLGLAQLPTKTHLHVYLRSKDDDNSTVRTDAGRRFSLPYHVDRGLYLLVTPSPALPLLLRSRRGKNIRTDPVAPDTVLVLLGRGLTHWMMPPTTRGSSGLLLTPAAHAVPTLTGTRVSSRTIMARMKVAPSGARPIGNPEASVFSEAFLGGGRDDTSARNPASLCEFGAPLTEAESRLTARQRRDACWPHAGEVCGPRKWNGLLCTDADTVNAGRGPGSCLNDQGCPACAPFCSRSGYCQTHNKATAAEAATAAAKALSSSAAAAANASEAASAAASKGAKGAAKPAAKK